MALDFPNPSRSFDGTRNRVRFWGYDRASEISFFVGADTLESLCPGMMPGEAGCLAAFDSVTGRVHEMAARSYARGRGSSHSFVVE